MNSEALNQANERLARARDALTILNANGDQQARESAWIDLITALNTVYSKLEQGAKGNGKSEAWFGRRKHDRKTDPLLSYVLHARNSAEHGITKGGHYAKQGVSFSGLIKPGTMAGLRVTPNGVEPFSTDPDLDMQSVEDDIFLLSVSDRGKLYRTPKEHLGVKMTKFGARDVGQMAVDYVEAMLQDAATLT